MLSPTEAHNRQLAAIEDKSKTAPVGATHDFFAFLARQQAGYSPACGCKTSCDGMTTIVVWPCRKHWRQEWGAALVVIGGIFGLLLIAFIAAAILKAVA